MYFKHEVINKILEYYRAIWAITKSINLLEWDREVLMPKLSVNDRGVIVSELAALKRKLILSSKLKELVEKASKLEDLNEYEKGVVRVLSRMIHIAEKIPEELVKRMALVRQKATLAWREAKDKDNFEIFKPYLEEIVKLSRQKAEYLGYEYHPYDALIDLFDEGFTSRDYEEIFSKLKTHVKTILNKVLSEGYYPSQHELEKAKYSRKDLEKINLEILKMLGFPLGEKARFDVSAHPFTTEIGACDVRITTRYEGYDFKRTILSVLHEYGHALYHLQIDEKLASTPLEEVTSLGLHESQSRFWENIIGRSYTFIELIYSILKKHLDYIKKHTVEDIYLYFNTVRPSLIRTEADEVTYNLHIILRFELEKLMIGGEIKVSQIPELWNDLMEELLGVKAKRLSEGALQDIHWSLGYIGYFPSYTLGNILSAQVKYLVERELGSISSILSNKQFKELRNTLREKIHRWGSILPPKEFIERKLQCKLDVEHFINYLHEKYIRKRYK